MFCFHFRRLRSALLFPGLLEWLTFANSPLGCHHQGSVDLHLSIQQGRAKNGNRKDRKCKCKKCKKKNAVSPTTNVAKCHFLPRQASNVHYRWAWVIMLVNHVNHAKTRKTRKSQRERKVRNGHTEEVWVLFWVSWTRLVLVNLTISNPLGQLSA